MDEEGLMFEQYADYARRNGYPHLKLGKHHGIIEAALLDREDIFYKGGNSWNGPLPFSEERGRAFLKALKKYDLSGSRETAVSSPALEGRWYRSRSYALSCRRGTFPRKWPPKPGKPPEMITLEEWWVEAASRQVVEYKLEGDVLDRAVKALLSITPEPEITRPRESPPPRREGKKYRVRMLHPLPPPPMPEGTGEKVLSFFKDFGPLGLYFSDVHAFSTAIHGTSPPSLEVEVVLGPPLGRVGPPSLPLEKYFGNHLRNPEAVYREAEIRPVLSPSPVRGKVLDMRGLFREYREAVHEVYHAAWGFKRVCYTLRRLIEDPFGLADLEMVLSRCQLKLNREGRMRFLLRPRCLLDACYVHVIQGHVKIGQEWRVCRGCGIEFPAGGREKYCTPKCQSRTNVNRWRERQKAEDKTPGGGTREREGRGPSSS